MKQDYLQYPSGTGGTKVVVGVSIQAIKKVMRPYPEKNIGCHRKTRVPLGTGGRVFQFVFS